MLIAYVVVKMPFISDDEGCFFSIDNNMEEAARAWGFNLLYHDWVIIRFLLPVLMLVMALNFNSLLADYDLSVFLYHPLSLHWELSCGRQKCETATTSAKALIFVYTVVLVIMTSTPL